MRKIFLDCGSNLGQGFTKISQENNMNEEWEFYLFEPNFECCQILKESIKFPKLEIYQKAVSDNYGFSDLFIEFCPTESKWVGGATHINTGEYIKPSYIKDEYFKKSEYQIETIDLSDFIKKNFSFEDHIVLKLDIEGSEFNILKKMIQDKTLDYVNKIYIEWHDHFFSGNQFNEKNYILEKINEKNINYNIWY